MRRLAVLLDHIAATTGDGSLVVVHSQGTLVPARTTDTGATADWANEIHPSRAGYRRLGALWGPVIDRLFGAQPPTGAMDDEPLTLGELLSPAGSAPLS
jgi:hypothetical protein